MLGNENRYESGTGYDAYTQPAEQERREQNPAYSFTYEAPPPAYYPEEQEGSARGRAARAAAVLVALLLAAAILAAGVLFFSRFTVRFSGEDGMFSIQFAPRKAAEAPAPEIDLPDESEAPPNAFGGEANETIPWDGTTMVIARPRPVDPELPMADQMSYADIYKKCAPSIVVIEAAGYNTAATGTGVIMSGDGYIVTCSHVVDGGQQILVTLEGGEEYAATLVGQDSQTDLAVLKIDKKGLLPAEFGDSDALEVGETVVAIGNPMGQNLTMTNGIISAIDRSVVRKGYTMTLLQTNAAINDGNSGGALINCRGQVIGITNMKMMSYYSTVEGIGFAIPISSAKDIVDELLRHGYVAGRPAIGIRSSDIPRAAAAYYDLPEGVLVDYVYPDTDAQAKGLLRGDIITAVDGQAVRSTEEMDLIGLGYQAGDQAVLRIYRGGNFLELTIVLADKALLGR